MIEYKDLSELLEADSGAMAFYNSLPMTLQQKMYSAPVSTFKQIYESARSYKPDSGAKKPLLSAVSASEATGLIPQGADRSQRDWDGFSNIFPFGLPKQDK